MKTPSGLPPLLEGIALCVGLCFRMTATLITALLLVDLFLVGLGADPVPDTVAQVLAKGFLAGVLVFSMKSFGGTK